MPLPPSVALSLSLPWCLRGKVNRAQELRDREHQRLAAVVEAAGGTKPAQRSPSQQGRTARGSPHGGVASGMVSDDYEDDFNPEASGGGETNEVGDGNTRERDPARCHAPMLPC